MYTLIPKAPTFLTPHSPRSAVLPKSFPLPPSELPCILSGTQIAAGWMCSPEVSDPRRRGGTSQGCLSLQKRQVCYPRQLYLPYNLTTRLNCRLASSSHYLVLSIRLARIHTELISRKEFLDLACIFLGSVVFSPLVTSSNHLRTTVLIT